MNRLGITLLLVMGIASAQQRATFTLQKPADSLATPRVSSVIAYDTQGRFELGLASGFIVGLCGALIPWHYEKTSMKAACLIPGGIFLSALTLIPGRDDDYSRWQDWAQASVVRGGVSGMGMLFTIPLGLAVGLLGQIGHSILYGVH